jgi:hypothetical protein
MNKRSRVITFILASFLMGDSAAHAVDLDQIGLKIPTTAAAIPPASSPPPVIEDTRTDVLNKTLVGRCDGRKFYDQPSYEGCLRTINAAMVPLKPGAATNSPPLSTALFK